MSVENQMEQSNMRRDDEILQVQQYTLEALREIRLPQYSMGGCTLMPRTMVVSAEDPYFDWDLNAINEVFESLDSSDISPSIPNDLANLFGRIIVGLRKGGNLIIQEGPK